MGKYNYQTRPDLSSDQKEHIGKSSDLVIKCWIANELAEANRLKRIEIDIMITNIVDVGQLAYTKSENYQEDRA